MRSGLRMTPLEKRVLMITMIGFFVLLGVIVNDRAAPKEVEPQNAKRSLSEFPIDINRASEKDLEKLPMIGPVKAKAIVDYRNKNGPFRKVEDIVKVSGIGEKTLERIRDYVTVSGSPSENTKIEVEDRKINVNTASPEELEKLPGIGKVKAKRIIENRPYKEPKDLLKVPGIGKKTLEKIRNMIDF